MLALALAAALSLSPPDTVLTPADGGPADGGPASRPVEVSPRFALSSLYSVEAGFGIGGGVEVRTPALTATVDARVAQHLQSGAATLATRDAGAPAYVRLRGVATTQTRQRYFGLGPFTDRDDRVWLDAGRLSAELRAGLRPAGRALTVQPSARLRYRRLRTVDPGERETLRTLDARSRRAVESVENQGRWSVAGGLALELDLRDRPAYPSAGGLAGVEVQHVAGLGDDEVRFWRGDVQLAGFVPLPQRVMLFGRFDGTVTRPTDSSPEIAYDDLPTVDADRLAGFPLDRLRGRDVLLVSAGARIPIIDALGVFGLDAVVTGSLGGAYTDVFDELSTRVAFGDVSAADARAPLRPALSVGLALVNIAKGRVAFGGAVSVGPEGGAFTGIRLSTDLNDPRTPIW